MKSDFNIEAVDGTNPDYRTIIRNGRDAALAAGVWSLLSSTPLPGFIQAPSKVRIKAGGDVADDAGGAGAREVTVFGLLADGKRGSAVLVTNGVAASLESVEEFWRIDDMAVSKCGSYVSPWNIGNVVVEAVTGAVELCSITALEGRSIHAVATIPVGWTARLRGAWVSANVNQPADFRLMARARLNIVVPPVDPIQVIHYWDGVEGVTPPYQPLSPTGPIVGPSEIWMEGQGSSGGSKGTGTFEVLFERTKE